MSMTSARSGGTLLIEQLIELGADWMFCVPGESYLPVLDACYAARHRLRLISCRHEGGAALMAEAHGRLAAKPGLVFVTRGPGAANAAIGVHVAYQSSSPVVLFVGQVPTAHRGREAFQEVDHQALFAPIAKQTLRVAAAGDIGDAVAAAYAAALAGRPGPVVVELPEDVLDGCCDGPLKAPVQAPAAGPTEAELEATLSQLQGAQRPLLILGGTLWSEQARAAVQRFAAANDLPIMCAFRRQDIFDNEHRCYAGYLGLNAHADAWRHAADADCILALGTRLDEASTRGYRLFDDGARRAIIHVYPDPRGFAEHLQPVLEICADTAAFSAALAPRRLAAAAGRSDWCNQLHRSFERSLEPPRGGGPLDLSRVMATLDDALPDSAIITIDAGNFTVWPQRYRRYRRPGRLLGPINGAMGYGVPAAVAASLMYPDRQVVCFVGDGGMLMTGMELATALHYGAKPIILVVNNGMYGTIRLHQERRYPGRVMGTDLTNPDFAALARSFGAFGARVERTAEFAPALHDALNSGGAALLELRTDPDLLLPGLRISDLTKGAGAAPE